MLSSLTSVRERIAELQDEVQAVLNLAQGEDRDLGDAEADSIDSIMAEIGEPGDDPSGLRADEARLERIDAEKQRVALARSQSDKQPAPVKAAVARPRAAGKLRAFRGDNGERDAYTCGMWLKAMITGDERARQFCADAGVEIYAGQTEGTNTEGGFLVPDPLAAAIIDVREDSGVSRRICDVVPMSSDTLALPKRNGGLTVYYPGEATAISLSDAAFAQVSLTAVKRATLTKISNELLRDSVISVADRVAMEIGRALALQEDNELVNGDGTGTYGSETGIISGLGAAGKVTLGSGDTTWSTVTLADLNDVAGLLPEKYHPNASWLVSRAFYAKALQRLAYAAGGNTTENIAGAAGPSFFGYPINFSDQMPADAADKCSALFGSFSDAVVIGSRDGVEIASSSDYAFNEDVTAVRGTVRYDINVHDAGDGSNAGGVVGLFTAAT